MYLYVLCMLTATTFNGGHGLLASSNVFVCTVYINGDHI